MTIGVREWPNSFAVTVALTLMTVMHLGLLSWSVWSNSPVSVEQASLAAGLRTLRDGDLTLFRVNPPLIRCWAAIPVSFLSPKMPEWTPQDNYLNRSEFDYGVEFVKANQDQRTLFFRVARLSCLPFSVIAMIVCYHWAAMYAGRWAGLLSAWIWCFSPSVLGHGALLTNDVPAASTAVVACFLFELWLRSGRSGTALAAAVALGVAMLSKLTLVLLPAIWIIEWSISKWMSTHMANENREPVGSILANASSVRMLVGIIILSVTVVNIGYGGKGVWRPLGTYEFVSRFFAGSQTIEGKKIQSGNRYRGTVLGGIPIPLPADYLLGLDQQRRDLEAERPCYLAGHWRSPPTYEFYLYAFLVKLPCGTLLIAATAVLAFMAHFLLGTATFHHYAYAASLLRITLPPSILLLLLSSQNSAGGHFRYSIVCLPFLFIIIGILSFEYICRKRIGILFVVTISLVIAIESLWCMPHSLGFFNWASGGPANAHRHLLGTNADWGQDLDQLSTWWIRNREKYSKSSHMYVACTSELPIECFFGKENVSGPQCSIVDITEDPSVYNAITHASSLSSLPAGVYAISLNNLYAHSSQYRIFQSVPVCDMVGTSIAVYEVNSP